MSQITKFTLLILLLLMSSFFAGAQEDVPLIQYDSVIQYTFEEANGQYFAQFEAKSGDVVYLTAKYDGFVVGQLEIDIRDSVGRSVGQQIEYIFQKYTVGEITKDGLYTVVVTSEEPELTLITLGKTGYINDGASVEINKGDSIRPFLIRVDKNSQYTISYERLSGDLDVNFIITDYAPMFTENTVDISGLGLSSWTIRVELTKNAQYIAFIGEPLISFGSGDSSTINIILEEAK